jgi:phosphate uptake regulator
VKHRKIQLIAGTTYSISLPKEWVKRNNLKEKQELAIYEREDKTLLISSEEIKEEKRDKISMNVEECKNNIDRVLLELYYLGFENIELFSKTKLSKEERAIIKKTINCMSGTIVQHEDDNKIIIKILLDKSKVDIMQALYRMSLIAEQTLSNISEEINMEELTINENEVDQLYHLVTKIISLAINDSVLLRSSKIHYAQLIPSYLLIGKKLENLGDVLYYSANYLKSKNKGLSSKKEILSTIKEELNRTFRHVLANYPSMFIRISDAKIKKLKENTISAKDQILIDYFNSAIKFLVDIQEEVIDISFYNHMTKKGVI